MGDVLIAWTTLTFNPPPTSPCPGFFFLSIGKTIMLVLQGLRWLRQGYNVHVVSTRHGAMAASLMIQHQLQMTLRGEETTASPSPGTVVFHSYDFYDSDADVNRAVFDLVSVSSSGETMCVLLDEIQFDERY